METNEKRNSREKFLWILTAALVIIIILLLLMNWNCHKKLAEEKSKLSAENSLLKETLAQKDSIIYLLKNQNERLFENNVELSKALVELSEQLAKCQKYQKRERTLMNEIHSIKNEIRNLAQKVDSLENGFVVKIDSLNNSFEENPCDSNNVVDVDFITKKLSFKITKKLWNKKHTKIVKESEFANYSSNLVFIEGGFLEDSYSKTYEYMDPESNPQKITFNSLVDGKYSTLTVSKNGNGLTYHNEAEFVLGAGGLLVPDREFPWETTIPFLEKTINYDLKRRATWEIVGGSLVGIAGGFGIYYFDKYPEATITVNDSKGSQIFNSEIQNEFGKAISAGLVGIGTGLVAKGIVDKIISVRVSPTEFGLIYTIK